MKRIFKILTFVVAASVLYTCSDYLDVNQDPNNPTTDNVSPDMMLAGAMVQSFPTMPTTANRLGNLMTQAWAGDITNFTGAFQTEFSYDITNTFYAAIWNNIYVNTSTFSLIVSNEDPKYTNHNAIARIMKTYYFQYLVDLYGDIPYTEAHKLGGNIQPSYDDDEAIYGMLLDELNTAISLINNAPIEALTVGNEDVMMGGDMAKWVRFANTLKLRLLLRQQATGIYNSQFASLNGAEFIGAGDNVTINPGYADATGQLNPFYGQFHNVGGTNTSSAILYVPADYTAKFLTGETTQNSVTTNIYDPRVERLFTLEGGSINGVVQGENDPAGATPLSHLGPGLDIGPDQDGYIMTAAESLFLQAEAAYRNYISGDAAALFRSGISESFSVLGIASAASAYLTSSENVNLIGWTGSSNKIEAIMTQKWIAQMGIHAVESWIEYTRTGYPVFPNPTIAQQPNRFNRLMYPITEYVGNAENVPTQTSTDAFNTHIFWDVN